ncbi:MAG: AHH domain-containing protein [Novosphingobium sp.]|nr:AHH domain-containing protein [Novosphingobium sp.]
MVNHRDASDYDAALQRHHLLPRQLLGRRCFAPLFASIGPGCLGFDDFRTNGLLLPAREAAAVRLSLPLHRGPHRGYNGLVIERVGQVEARWAAIRGRSPESARDEAAFRLALLQRALRRRLLSERRRPLLSRFDPLAQTVDFSALDALADSLWPATAAPESLVEATLAASSAWAS